MGSKIIRWPDVTYTTEYVSDWPVDSLKRSIGFAGRLDLLKWVIENGGELYPRACKDGARGGHIELVKWVVEKGCPVHVDASFLATRQGDLEMLRWLKDHGGKWDRKVTVIAAKKGYFELLKWVIEQGCPWHHRATRAAIGHHQEEILKWAVEHGCPWHPKVCEVAAKKGELELMQWAIKNGCTWTDRVCELAVDADKVEILQWASDNGAPFDKDGILWVGIRRDMPLVVQWALGHGCQWDEKLCRSAMDNPSTRVLTWAKENGHPLPFDFCKGLMEAVKTDELPLVKWFWKNGGAEENVNYCTKAAKKGSYKMLKWLKKKKVPWSLDTVIAAVRARQFSVLSWILNRQKPFDDF